MDPRFRGMISRKAGSPELISLSFLSAASTLPRSTPNQVPRGEAAGREKAGGDNYATIRRPETKVIKPGFPSFLISKCKLYGSFSFLQGVGTELDEDRAERLGRSRGSGRGREILASKSVDYSDNELAARDTFERKKSRSKSTDDVTERERNGPAGPPPPTRRGLSQQAEVHHGPYS